MGLSVYAMTLCRPRYSTNYLVPFKISYDNYKIGQFLATYFIQGESCRLSATYDLWLEAES